MSEVTMRDLQERRSRDFAAQARFDAGLIEAFGVLVEHLADRGFVDLAFLRSTIAARVEVWSAGSASPPEAIPRPVGLADERATALNLILGAMPAPPTPPADKAN